RRVVLRGLPQALEKGRQGAEAEPFNPRLDVALSPAGGGEEFLHQGPQFFVRYRCNDLRRGQGGERQAGRGPPDVLEFDNAPVSSDQRGGQVEGVRVRVRLVEHVAGHVADAWVREGLAVPGPGNAHHLVGVVQRGDQQVRRGRTKGRSA